MLARAQEIENLDRQVRAQALIADEARGALVRAEAAYTDASQRLAVARREAGDAQSRAHQLQVELLRLSQQAEQTGVRREQLDDGVRRDRRAAGRARPRAAPPRSSASRSSTCGSAPRRSGMPSSRRRRAAPSRRSATRASSCATLERVADEARFALRTLGVAPRRARARRSDRGRADRRQRTQRGRAARRAGEPDRRHRAGRPAADAGGPARPRSDARRAPQHLRRPQRCG